MINLFQNGTASAPSSRQLDRMAMKEAKSASRFAVGSLRHREIAVRSETLFQGARALEAEAKGVQLNAAQRANLERALELFRS